MLNIVFDATIFMESLNKDWRRSGLFFAAYNILLALIQRNDVNIYLYVSPVNGYDWERVKKELFPNIKCLNIVESKGWIARFNHLCWNLHRRFLNKSLIRKFFSLGIVISRELFEIRNKHYTEDALRRADIFLAPVPGIVPHFISEKKIKKCFVLYDAIPALFSWCDQKGWWKFYSKFMKDYGRNSHFFCISSRTKSDFQKFFPELNERQMSVAHLAAGENFVNKCDANLQECVKSKYGIPKGKKYVFSLCTLEPRKNLIRAVRTFIQFVRKNDISDLVWVMGGGHWDSFINLLKNELDDLDVKNVLYRIGYVDDEDLPTLYSGAEWFVYTSLYEGFGLPPLEAMQCGCPVIVGNNSSLPEVVGDAGLLIDSDSDEQHIASYEKYYYNSIFRKEMVCKGLNRAKMFSWEKTASSLVKSMQKDVCDVAPLNIVYRMCDSVSISNGNKRCFDVSKNQLIKKCLLSLKRNVESFKGTLKLYCVADNCSEDIVSFVEENFPSVVMKRYEQIGNAKSFCECIDLATTFSNGEQVYFLEDDYLFLRDDVLTLLNRNLSQLSCYNDCQIAIMPDDYPDRYVDNRVYTECCVTKTGHFLKIDKTTCTFATYVDVVKKNKDHFMKFIKWPKVTEDESVNLAWKKVPLYQPIPAWTLHSQTESVVPIYLDYAEIRDYFER